MSVWTRLKTTLSVASYSWGRAVHPGPVPTKRSRDYTPLRLEHGSWLEVTSETKGVLREPLLIITPAVSIHIQNSRSMMLRTALWICGAAVELYLVWNAFQLLFGILKERRSAKS